MLDLFYDCWQWQKRLSLYYTVILLTCTTLGKSQLENYQEQTGDYIFIYQTQQKYLLAVHGESCYFTHIDDDQLFSQFQSHITERVKALIATAPRTDVIQRDTTGLLTVETDNQDHCIDKSVFLLYLDFLECSFEPGTWTNTFCAWTPVAQKAMQWQSHRGSTPTVLTGPVGDHTSPEGRGHYIYVEGNEGVQGDTALLVSPVVSASAGLCLVFWYSMYGSGIGRLQVAYSKATFTASSETFPELSVLWTMEGNQGQGWRRAEVSMTSLPDSAEEEANRVQLYFAATRGHSMMSDIAVDDISSRTGPCAYALLSCSFEGGTLCSWSQRQIGDSLGWRITSGRSSFRPNIGPLAGHTGNGFYAVLDSENGLPGQNGVLESHVLHLDSSVCLTFWFSLSGSGVADLDLVLLDLSNMREHHMWGRSGDQGQEWLQARVTLSAPTPATPVQVLFRATRGISADGNIAVDDVSGHVGTCDQLHEADINPILG